jgi:hypothetical protein
VVTPVINGCQHLAFEQRRSGPERACRQKPIENTKAAPKTKANGRLHKIISAVGRCFASRIDGARGLGR